MVALRTLRRMLTATGAVLTVAALAGPAAASGPTPGAADLGDTLFPGLGNGGYNAQHYDLALRYATDDPAGPVDGTVTMVAKATQALSRLNLDFAGGGIDRVTVDGRAAAWSRQGEELVITPRTPLARNQVFVLVVRHFTATPTVADPDDFSTTALFVTPNGSAMGAQPNFAHLVFPVNDHPRDKATYSFHLDVPAGTTAVANGLLTATRTARGRTFATYLQRQPMASELVQVAVGDFDVTSPGGHPGVWLRNVTPPSLTAQLRPQLAAVVGQLAWMTAQLGRFPFDAYGSLVVDEPLGFALETQTLSLFDAPWFTDNPQGLWDPVMVHELSHQWFGDSVAPYAWSDLWLSEGHATWYETTYAQEKGWIPEDTGGAPDFESYLRANYAYGDQDRADFGPVAAPLSADTLFSFNVYVGGALVLYALRQQVGMTTFDAIERTWVARFRNKSASTRDFIALTSEVSGQDLGPFLESWLYGTKIPPMPGHPDWTVLPVTAAPGLSIEQRLPAGARRDVLRRR